MTRSFQGYFDDSGKVQDRPSLVVAGFVGTLDQWSLLARQWNPLLEKYRLGYFHSNECEHGNGEFDKARKSEWKDPRLRSECRMEFVAAIVSAGLTGFVAGVVSADYKALNQADRKRIGTAFSFAAQTLVVEVKNWANRSNVYELFPYLFEAGSHGYGEFAEIFKKAAANEIRRNAYRMQEVGVVGKESVGAQSADLLAYEYSHCMNSVVAGDRAGFGRVAVAELDRRLHIHAHYQNSNTIAEVLAAPKSEYRLFRPRPSKGRH